MYSDWYLSQFKIVTLNNDSEATPSVSSNKILLVFTKSCKVPKTSANWVMGEVSRVLNEKEITIADFTIPSSNLAELITLIEEDTITGKMAKGVFEEMLEAEDKSPRSIVDKKGLKVVSDEGQIESLVADVIVRNPKQVKEYQSGKQKIIGFFVGQIMKATQGKANPSVVNKILKEKLLE